VRYKHLNLKHGLWFKRFRLNQTCFKSRAALDRGRWAYDLRTAHGVRVVELDGAATRAHEPCHAPHVEAGLWLPDIATVRDPLALTEAVVARFVVLGGTLLPATVGALHREGSRLPEMLAALYGATGPDAREAVATTPFYRGLAPQDPSLWRRWLAQDVPFALKPAAALARLAGLASPLHAGLAAVFDAILGDTGAPMTLADLGLDGLTAAQALRYVETRDRP